MGLNLAKIMTGKKIDLISEIKIGGVVQWTKANYHGIYC